VRSAEECVISTAARSAEEGVISTAARSAEEGVISTAARSAEWRDPRISTTAPQPTTFLPPNHYDLNLNNETLHVRSPLPGQHQQRNIALAIAAAIEVLTSNPEPRTSNLIPAIEAGIASTSWPGRLEFLPPNLLLDVAHNPAGAWTLRAAIASLPDDQPRTLIFSCLRDKDLREMAQILFPLFDSSNAPPGLSSRSAAEGSASPSNLEPSVCHSRRESAFVCPPAQNHLVLTPIDNPRAASLDDLIAAAQTLDVPAHPAQSPAEALALARSLTPPGGLILATGSVYLIGTLRDLALTGN
jgi:dihydrofolate synthase / folylpolyglutamate synthase